MDAISGVGSPLVIGGDFNVRHSSWRHLSYNACGVALHEHSLRNTYRIVAPDEFTFHGTPRQNPSILDIFLVDSGRGFDCEITGDFGTSHRPVVLSPSGAVMHPPDRVRTTDWDEYGRLTGGLKLRALR